MLPNDRVYYLWEIYTSGKANPQEEQELMEWIVNSEDDPELKNYLQKVWKETETSTPSDHVNWDELFERILHADRSKVISIPPTDFRRKTRWPLVAAAAILILCITSYFLFTAKTPGKNSPKLVQQENTNDILAPVENRAFIKSSNGQTITLNNVHQGLLAIQGDTRLMKRPDGLIFYERTAGKTTGTLQYNTLYNPKGSKVIDVVLADGSHVWLNAASSITYPVDFTGNERRVNIKGEAYFEVAHNANMPFKVIKNKVEVTVLGTHFNVNAYDDGPSLKVSLLQGSVRVTNGQQKTLLRPGQQAQVKTEIKVQNDMDMEQVIAWKDGLFSFKNTSLEEMMQQISRWYDVDVRFEGPVPQINFGGKIPRSSSMMQVLKILEEYNVHYRFNKREIVILP